MKDNRCEPFDIERALKGEPLIRRNGDLIKEYECFYSKYLEKNNKQCIIIVVKNEKVLHTYFKNGREMSLDFINSYDLFMVPKEMNDNKYEPFDIERALKGEPLITRNGRLIDEYEIYHFKELNDNHQSVFLFDKNDEDSGIESYCKNGSYLIDEENDEDLFMAPKERK